MARSSSGVAESSGRGKTPLSESILGTTQDFVDVFTKLIVAGVAIAVFFWPSRFYAVFHPEQKLSAVIGETSGGERETLQQYLNSVGDQAYSIARDRHSETELQQYGAVVTFSLELHGDLKREVTVYDTLIDRTNGRPASIRYMAFQTSGDSQDDTAFYRVWIPLPNLTTRYSVLIEARTSYDGTSADENDVAATLAPLEFAPATRAAD